MKTPEETTAKEYGMFTVEIRRILEKNYWKEMAQLSQYSQTLMNILGVIAGFGFTAYGHIHSKPMFFTGEVLVVGSILYLAYQIKKYIAGQPMSTENQLNGYTEKARQIKSAFIAKDSEKIKSFAREFTENVEDISVSPPVTIAKVAGNSLEIAYWCSGLGITLIFLSFFICL